MSQTNRQTLIERNHLNFRVSIFVLMIEQVIDSFCWVIDPPQQQQQRLNLVAVVVFRSKSLEGFDSTRREHASVTESLVVSFLVISNKKNKNKINTLR